MDELLIGREQRFATLVEEDCDHSRPRCREICQATDLSVSENQALVDVGGKRDGVVRRGDLEPLDDTCRAALQAGDGVFMDAGQGVEGLVHTSQMLPGGIDDDAELASGSLVAVRVSKIDRRRHRIGLGLRDITAVDDSPGTEQALSLPASPEIGLLEGV
jgi:ribosomal protein S1